MRRLRFLALAALLTTVACSGAKPSGGDAGPAPADAGCACAPGVCLGDGGCAECLQDADCSASGLSRCEPASLTCVACLPDPDTCAAGEYCTGAFACAAGCKASEACPGGGSCGSGHECSTCLADGDCLPGRICQSGACADPCTASSCGALACCTPHCVDTARDIAHCGACGNACAADAFCDGTGCQTVQLANLCANPAALVLLDGLSFDDAAAPDLAAALGSGCQPSVAAQVLDQADAGVLDPATGKPRVGGGLLLAAPGGPFGQHLVGYLESSGISPIYFRDTGAANQFVLRSDGGVVGSTAPAQVNSGHDLFVLELVREPGNGTLSLVVYGIGGYGTRSGVWYLANRVLPQRAGLMPSWYVVEWTDDGGADGGDTLPGDDDAWTLLGSGP